MKEKSTLIWTLFIGALCMLGAAGQAICVQPTTFNVTCACIGFVLVLWSALNLFNSK